MELNVNGVRAALELLAAAMAENKELLTKLDAAMGDGDLGVYMEKGFRTAAQLAGGAEEGAPGALLVKAGRGFMEQAPSTLGTLVGVAMVRIGKTMGDAEALSLPQVADALAAGCAEIEKRGKAKRGEKTILDSVGPAVDALQGAAAAGEGWPQAFDAAQKAAEEGEAASRAMVAVHGRPAYFGRQTVGMQDGGATTGLLIFRALHKAAQQG